MVCYSAGPELADYLAGRVIKVVDHWKAEFAKAGLPAPNLVNLGFADNLDWCGCAKCRTAPTSADGYLRLINAVAARVKPVHPDTLIEILIYFSAETPPRKLKPADNVLPMYCTTSFQTDRPIGATENLDVMQKLTGWGTVSRRTRVWHYARSYASCRNQLDIDGVEYGGYDFPTPNAFYFADSVRAWQANKVHHVFIQNEMTLAHDMPEMKSWLWAKLIEDPTRDADKLMNEFLAGYYGSAGKAVRQYLDYLKQRAAAAPSSTNWFSGLKCGYLDEAFYQTADQILRNTEAALGANTDPIYRQRLNEVRCSALRGFLVQWPSIAQRWVAAGNDIAKYPIDRDRLYELYVKTQEARIATHVVQPPGVESTAAPDRVAEPPAQRFRALPSPAVAGAIRETTAPRHFRFAGGVRHVQDEWVRCHNRKGPQLGPSRGARGQEPWTRLPPRVLHQGQFTDR